MPLAARAELMVRRGEAPDFPTACSLLARRRRRARRPVSFPAATSHLHTPLPALPAAYRPPYAD